MVAMVESETIGGSKQGPDPSALTTQQTLREVGMLKELMETRLEAVESRLEAMDKATALWHEDLVRVPTQVDKSVVALRDLIETRLVCMENDVRGVHTFLDTRGKDISEQIIHLRELVHSNIKNLDERLDKQSAVSSERFARIETQFVERDKRTDQLSLADKTAVAAALQAAKEAVGAQNTSNSIAIAKIESSTVESIRQLQALFNTANVAMNDKINDVKSRLDKGEGRVIATTEVRTDNRASLGVMISAAVAAVAILGAIVTVVVFLNRAPQTVYVPVPQTMPPQNNLR